MYHSNVSGRSSELRALLIAGFIRRISFVNNGWAKRDHRAIEISVSTNHIWRERKETTRANVGRNAK
ncbi:hypothetical protein T05_7375 [Trichinella murrelli]|uniref:Uncharacterized protein n=1 Tax=Trichinella murrelli TaxID=144512 RepID=A0A0V0SSJ6_9BILA|nr:hypothetical protein T05_7375 [Trichinella murrelli]